MDDLLHPFLDRRPNGRCRSFWIAHEVCPGNMNGWDYASKNYEKFLEKAIKLDEKDGMLPCCKPQKWDRDAPTPRKLKPIRTRVRKR